MTKELKDWTDEELEDGRQQLLPVAGNDVAATVNADAVFALSAIEREQKLRRSSVRPTRT